LYRLHEAFRAPQAIHNRIVVERDVPHLGKIRAKLSIIVHPSVHNIFRNNWTNNGLCYDLGTGEARPAPILSKTPMRSGGAPPLYGEHTDQILVESGYVRLQCDVGQAM
jgi:hypothetical protein